MRVYHTTESYINLVDSIHKGKYTYAKTKFTKMSDRVTVTCRIHGDFEPTALNHKTTGCPKCFNSIRGANLRLTKADFLVRLKQRPLYKLVSPYVDGTSKVTLECELHGEFKVTPTRLLSYENNCPLCNICSQNNLRVVRNAARVASALRNLPKYITCLTETPSWSKPELFSCQYHGQFKSELSRSSGMEYMCNECAKDHWRGVARTTYEEYLAFVRKLFPNPLHSFTIDEQSYKSNVGTRLVVMSCSKHGKFQRHRSTVNNGKLDTPCPLCKLSGVSSPENELVTFVRSLLPCEQGNRSIIKPKELDCYIPAKSLAIEFCGLYWHSEAKINKEYHQNKTLLCKEKGVSLIHIFEDEWLNKKEICKSIIRNNLGFSSKKFYGRKLTYSECAFDIVKEFFNNNHIQGFVPAQKYCVLLDSTGVVRAAASFSLNRLKKDNTWELVRYCSALDTNVIGGLSKVVKNFMRGNGVNRLISYCCLRWFSGEGYSQAGFTGLGVTPISYFYTNKQTRYSRYSTTKKKLKTLLPNFDDRLTETKNMEAAGFLKIYDCGNLLFEYVL